MCWTCPRCTRVVLSDTWLTRVRFFRPVLHFRDTTLLIRPLSQSLCLSRRAEAQKPRPYLSTLLCAHLLRHRHTLHISPTRFSHRPCEGCCRTSRVTHKLTRMSWAHKRQRDYPRLPFLHQLLARSALGTIRRGQTDPVLARARPEARRRLHVHSPRALTLVTDTSLSLSLSP